MNSFYKQILYSIFLLCLILLFDPSSIFSFLYTLGVFSLFNKLFFSNSSLNYKSFYYYISISILLYISHRFIIPEYIGLTGPENGVGTDDCRYYAQLVGGNTPFNNDYFKLSDFPFTFFLRFIYPFEIHSPLNIILVNTLGIIFIPYYIMSLTKIMFNINDNIANKAANLFLICPFTTYYGCIIMRDMWTVLFIVAGLYYFLTRKYLIVFLLFLLLAFIRFGSVVFLGAGLFVFFCGNICHLLRTKGQALFMIVIMILCVVVGYWVSFPVLQSLSDGKLEAGFFRTSFVSQLSNMDDNALLLKLVEFPFPLNTLMLFVFFFFCPFLSFNLFYENYFLIGSLFNTILTPVFMFFLWPSILKPLFNILNNRVNRNLYTLVLLLIILTFLLATISLQFRHKTVLFPFLCMLAAVGASDKTLGFSRISYLLSFCIVAVQLLFAIK